MFRSCVAYELPLTTALGPILGSNGRMGEAPTRPTDDVVAWDEECYG